MRKRIFKKENCQTTVRKTLITSTGKMMCLIGHHAFEWSIIEDDGQKVTKTTYPNRKSATKEFDKLKRKYMLSR